MANISKLSFSFIDGTTVINADKLNAMISTINNLVDAVNGSSSGGGSSDTPTNGNLFNVLNIQMESGVDETNGLLVDSTGRCATAEYIPVKPNTAYTMTSKYKLAWYDSDKNFISGSGTSETGTTYTSPSNAAYCRMSFDYATTNPTLMVFNEGTTLLQGLEEQSLPKGTNLVNQSTIVDGEGIKFNDGSSMTSSTSKRTDYFAVLPNKEYAFYYRKVIAWYDSSKNFISAIDSQTNTGGDMTKVFTSPSNAAYCRFSVKSSQSVEKIVVVQGKVAYL